MRLLHTTDHGKLEFTEDITPVDKIPRYAILSHTWGQQEVLFSDIKSLDGTGNRDARKKDGRKKIDFCAQQAKRDGLEYFWVDSCCIDKANHTELSEAINSMFRWYQRADRCYVFLSDVEGKSSEGDDRSSSRWKAAFRPSRWFSRGWTLQELLAPRSVEFFSNDEVRLGDKESLRQTIHEITKIPIEALTGSDLSKFDIDERFSWAQSRQTTREEDGAYCLLGIFSCHLPLIYGEGKKRALERLRKEMPEASERLSKIRCWLTAPDSSTNYHKAQKQRQADTGLWLLNSTQFGDWMQDAASRLWLYGIPGCGKTILSSTIIEHLQQHCNGNVHKVTVYFYFDFNDSQKRDPELMLRSWLHQLLQRLVVTCDSVDTLFSSCQNGKRQPSLHELVEVIPQVIRKFTHVYVVLDALDECTQRPELMSMLESVIEWKLDMVHLLLTSRKERDIEMSLKSLIKKDNVIGLQRDVVDEDISRYVRDRLQIDNALAKWNKNASIRQEIETALMQKAGGMFRWAACQLDMLAKCRNLAMLRKSLKSLPQTLDQTYDRILTAISEEDSVYAIRILQWLTFSERPLHVEEVAEVVALDVEREPIFDRDEVLIDPLDALEICSSLITVTGTAEKRWDEFGRPVDTQIFTLAHYSVQEYLVSDRIRQGPAKQYHMQEVESHEAMMRGCIGYLNQFQEPISEAQFDISALAIYSASYWHRHFRKAGEEKESVCRLAMSIFSMNSPAYISWVLLHDPDHKYLPLQRALNDIAQPLYYASLLSLSRITEFLLEQGADVNAQGGIYRNALMAASARGHTAVAKLLINAGANINSAYNYDGTPLYTASNRGHEAVVKLLIDAGAHVNATMPNWYPRNALQAAIEDGHEATIALLLERGAYCGLDEKLKGPIHYAANSGRCTPSIVTILQQYGASLDAIDANNMTPLHYCVDSHDQAIARHLLDAGVQINIGVRRRSWPSNCDTSSLVDQMETMHRIPESTAIGLTPLHFALLIGNPTMTQFLLNHGADPNALSEYGETPLHLNLRATPYGMEYEDSWTDLGLRVESLLASKNPYGNRIHADRSAAASARGRILDMLLAHPNISTAARDYKGENLLHCIRYGKPESAALVQRVLSGGADPSCVNLSQICPLHLASKAGDTESVRALISAGAKVSLTDERGLNAIHYAAQSGNLDTITAILETKDAKSVNLLLSKDRNGRNVLHHIGLKRSENQMNLIQWLLDQGANITELDTSGNPPLASMINRLTSSMNIEVFKLFLEYKGNALFVNDEAKTLGHLCVESLDFGIDLLQVLSDHDVNLAKKDHNGRTVLHHAAMNGSVFVQSLDFLVNNIGIQIDEKDNFGRTALDYVVESAAKNDYGGNESDGYSGSDSDGDIDIDGDDDSGIDSDSGSCISDHWERTRDILLNHQADHMN